MAYQIVDPSGVSLATARSARDALTKLHELRPLYENVTAMDPAGTIVSETDLEHLSKAERQGRLRWVILPDASGARIVRRVIWFLIIAMVALILTIMFSVRSDPKNQAGVFPTIQRWIGGSDSG